MSSRYNLDRESATRVDNARADLRYIFEETRGDADRHQLRRISGTLRQLLTDKGGLLPRAWKALNLGGQPLLTIRRPGLLEQNSEFAFFGSTETEGSVLQAISFRFTPFPLVNGFPPENIIGEEALVPLNEYLQSPLMVARGKKIRRHIAVTYMSNKLGGTHLDFEGRRDKQDYAALDDSSDLIIMERDVVSLSILSIGQELSKSEDLKKFLEAADSALEDYQL